MEEETKDRDIDKNGRRVYPIYGLIREKGLLESIDLRFGNIKRSRLVVDCLCKRRVLHLWWNYHLSLGLLLKRAKDLSLYAMKTWVRSPQHMDLVTRLVQNLPNLESIGLLCRTKVEASTWPNFFSAVTNSRIDKLDLRWFHSEKMGLFDLDSSYRELIQPQYQPLLFRLLDLRLWLDEPNHDVQIIAKILEGSKNLICFQISYNLTDSDLEILSRVIRDHCHSLVMIDISPDSKSLTDDGLSSLATALQHRSMESVYISSRDSVVGMAKILETVRIKHLVCERQPTDSDVKMICSSMDKRYPCPSDQSWMNILFNASFVKLTQCGIDQFHDLLRRDPYLYIAELEPDLEEGEIMPDHLNFAQYAQQNEMNFRRRQTKHAVWTSVAVLISFIRANHYSQIRYSVLPLCSMIVRFAQTDQNDMKRELL